MPNESNIMDLNIEETSVDTDAATTSVASAEQSRINMENHQAVQTLMVSSLKDLYAGLISKGLVYIDRLGDFGKDALVIGDLYFADPRVLTGQETHIPPIAIAVDKQSPNFRWQTLRTKETQKVANGQSRARISVTLFFVGTKDINSGLRRLLATFNTTPFVYIDNAFIRTNLAPTSFSTSDNMACSLVSISVRTVPGMVNVLAADLDLMWFNYRPFTPNFWFRESWEAAANAPKTVNSVCDRKLLGSESSSLISEEELQVQLPILKADPSVAYSSPAIRPEDSSVYTRYIDTHLGDTVSAITNRIVFNYREYAAPITSFDNSKVSGGRTNINLLAEVSNENLISFGAVLKMEPTAAQDLENMAEGFTKAFSKPGKPKRLMITSCFRTREQQAELKQKYPKLAATDSWHEVGLAIDIATWDAKMTREEYQWLQNNCKTYGFTCLGTRLNSSPAFDDGGTWRTGNPDAVIVKTPAILESALGYRAFNYETWHFDHTEGQAAARGNGLSQPDAIRKRRAEIYYTSGDLNKKGLVSETGEETTAEEIQRRDEAYTTSVDNVVRGFLSKGYWLDLHGTDPSRLLFYKPKQLVIEHEDTELIPQGIMAAKHNLIAELPILGYEYSTQQFMGSSDIDAAISFISLGTNKLSQLQRMFETLQNNSRLARGVRDGAIVDIENSVINFVGMDSCLLENISSQNIQGSPDAYSVNLTLTQAKRVKRPALKQTNTFSPRAWHIVAEWIYNNMFEVTPDKIRDLDYLYRWSHNLQVADWYRATLTAKGQTEEAIEMVGPKVFSEDVSGPGPTTKGLDTRCYLKTVADLIVDPIRLSVYGVGEQRSSKSWSKRAEAEDADVTYLTGVKDTEISTLLLTYAETLSVMLTAPLPPEHLERLGMSKFIGLIDPQSIARTPAAEYEQVFKNLKARLTNAWNMIATKGLYYHPVFTKLLEDHRPIFDSFITGNPCYPDLDLPPNPATGRPIDTPPDFYFWNESIDASVGTLDKDLDLVEKAREMMANSYESCKQFGSYNAYDEYHKFNQEALDKKNKKGVRTDKNKMPSDRNEARKLASIKLATLPYDEGGIGLKTSYDIRAQKIKNLFNGDFNQAKDNRLLLTDANLASASALDPASSIKFGRIEEGNFKEDVSSQEKMVGNGGSTRMREALDKSLKNFDSEVFRMAKAFPTFRISFIEEDMDDSGRLDIRNFEDFYSYAAIKDIRIVRDRKIPADLCVISITNIYGELESLAYAGSDEYASINAVEKFNPLKINTKLENPFSKLVVVEGSKIQLKLGYSNNPEALEIIFTGQVVEVGVSPISPDIMQLVCQSYGVELVSKKKTDDRFVAGYDNTQELLSAMICSPEVRHFGRYSSLNLFDPAEIRNENSGDDRYLDYFGLRRLKNWSKLEIARSWSFLNKPQDDNIYAPVLSDYTNTFEGAMDVLNVVGIGDLANLIGFIDDDRTYYVWRQTTWDVFKEMELRHPGYVASPVPYENRYTMFFGPPDHCYWARPLKEQERAGLVFNKDMMEAYNSLNRLFNVPFKTDVKGFRGILKPMAEKYMRYSKEYNDFVGWLARVRYSRFRPFRNYHFLSSRHNIIANNMNATSYGTFNAISLTYLEDTHKKPVEDFPTENDTAAIKAEMDAIEDEGEVLEMKADDNILDIHLRTQYAVHTGCFGEYFARRYAVSHLMRSLRDVYKGDITILGDPTIKPYDVCYLFDEYREIFGPVEVGRVTHILSQETGFITQIKPDLILHHNDYTTQSTMAAMGAIASEMFGSTIEKVQGVGAAIAIGAVALGGLAIGGIGLALIAFGGYKIASWSQGRQPLFITPVICKGRPYIAGLNGFKRDSLLMNIKGKWKHLKENVTEGWDDFYQRSPVSSWLKEHASELVSMSDEIGGEE